MQQTTKYKLDLIEKTDAFSPEALNENAQKVETALAALDDADALLDGRATDLESRVTALEVKKIVMGSYTGNGKVVSVDLGFTPAAVLVCGSHFSLANPVAVALADRTAYVDEKRPELIIVEGGFRAGEMSYTGYLCANGKPYCYIAFG